LDTNCYILGDSETRQAAVIDPGDDMARILKELEKLELSCAVILLTHGHPDHYGAALQLSETVKAKVYLHPEDQQFYGLKADAELADGQALKFGSLTLQVLHTPGHTPGSVCFIDEENLFAGDTLFCGSVGRTDLPGGDGEKMNDSLEKIKQLPPALKLYPGHGEPGYLEEELETNPFLLEEGEE